MISSTEIFDVFLPPAVEEPVKEFYFLPLPNSYVDVLAVCEG